MLSSWFVGAVLSLAPSAGEPGYVLETADTKRVEAVITAKIRCPNLKAEEWIAFLPALPELPGQVRVKGRVEPKGTVVKEQSAEKRGVFLVRVRADNPTLKQELSLKGVYETTLRSRVLRPLRNGERKPKVADLTPADRKLYLAAAGDIDFNQPDFKNWMTAQRISRDAKTHDVDVAREIFLAIRAKCKYEFKDKMDRRASAVCVSEKSDCGGLSHLFVAACRAQGIPARVLFGRWAKSVDSKETLDGKTYFQWHVKSEFFAAGVGWVPVDMAAGVSSHPTATGLDYFGVDKADFITFHVDPNLELDTIHFGKPSVLCLQSPLFWVSGGGSTEPTTVNEDWKVKTR
jgi:hypothetical protein